MPTLADVYNEREPFPIIQVITPTSVPGLDLIPSSIGMFDVEPLVNSSQALRKAMLDDALLELTADGPNYDMVLIDTPPNLGVFMLNSLLVSDFYLVPVDCASYFALEGMQTLESKIQQIKELHRDLKVDGLPADQVGQSDSSRSYRTGKPSGVLRRKCNGHHNPHQYGFGEGGICQTNHISIQGCGQWCFGLFCARQGNCSQVRRGAKIDHLK